MLERCLNYECQGHADCSHIRIGGHFMGQPVGPTSSVCFLIRPYLGNPFSKSVTFLVLQSANIPN